MTTYCGTTCLDKKTVELVIDGSSGDVTLERDMALLMSELFALWKRKQASYGAGNISYFGERGVIVRMWDKMQRLIRLVWHGLGNPLDDETIDDTYMDIADYGLIAVLVRRGLWPDAVGFDAEGGK